LPELPEGEELIRALEEIRKMQREDADAAEWAGVPRKKPEIAEEDEEDEEDEEREEEAQWTKFASNTPVWQD
jgi:hypothetical protein